GRSRRLLRRRLDALRLVVGPLVGRLGLQPGGLGLQQEGLVRRRPGLERRHGGQRGDQRCGERDPPEEVAAVALRLLVDRLAQSVRFDLGAFWHTAPLSPFPRRGEARRRIGPCAPSPGSSGGARAEGSIPYRGSPDERSCPPDRYSNGRGAKAARGPG